MISPRGSVPGPKPVCSSSDAGCRYHDTERCERDTERCAHDSQLCARDTQLRPKESSRCSFKGSEALDPLPALAWRPPVGKPVLASEPSRPNRKRRFRRRREGRCDFRLDVTLPPLIWASSFRVARIDAGAVSPREPGSARMLIHCTPTPRRRRSTTALGRRA